ncbi:NEDD4-binding protein 3-B [Amia ocellicauda]|uniref:NEDD4-binding protein 3-B n=1 Tax=Amia ocellicauda TaxID=2972642 RepID=UPI003464C23E
MATAQALHLTCSQSKHLTDYPYPPISTEQYRCTMGSVGSLIEKPDVSPEHPKGGRPAPPTGLRQHDGLLKKGFTQRELLNYLNITKKDPKAGKHIISGISSIKREHGREEENIYTKMYHKDGKEIDLGKNSLPVGGKFEKSRFRPSAFKPVTPKNFSSMQNLYPSKAEDQENGFSSGPSAGPYTKAAKTTVSSSSSSSSPPRHGGPGKPLPVGATSSRRGLSHDEENLSDSGHNSMNSLPPYRPPFRPHLSHISASMGHINHIGSLDRASVGSKGVASTATTDISCRSMATLHRLPCYGEAPPPYELSHSLEDVVRDLEDRLQEKEHELKQMRRNLDESEDAIAQVFEGKQRLWEKEVEELKRLYATKLRQVSQQAQRSQRTMQLQLYKAQQEKRRLQEDLEALQLECQCLKSRCSAIQEQDSPRLEETKWEVCQKSGEISLLKQQLRESQAEVTRKLSDVFQLKTQLREARGELRARDGQVEVLRLALQQGVRRAERGLETEEDEDEKDGGKTKETPCGLPGEQEAEGQVREGRGANEERLRAELLLERRQNEAQASVFESERRTWQTEKEKVIRYQKELQASYLEMYHKNQVLERELQELRGGSSGSIGTSAAEEDKQPPGLPWIERIESSEI